MKQKKEKRPEKKLTIFQAALRLPLTISCFIKILFLIWPSINTGCLFIPDSFRHSDLFIFTFVLTACSIKFDPKPVSFIKCIRFFNPSANKIIWEIVLLVLKLTFSIFVLIELGAFNFTFKSFFVYPFREGHLNFPIDKILFVLVILD